jgi:phospholipid/cholesterol/gamma-HCH transport system substrate-binding protein
MRRLRAAAAVVAMVGVLTACSGDEPTEVQAVFDDVIDLVEQNAVKLADVPVGTVTGIELTEDNRALVTMAVDPRLALPADVRARLRKTNLLGERFVELVADPASTGEYVEGTLITDTEVVPELEEAVFSGTQVIAAISADTLAGAIEAGAQGTDGRGETLGTTLSEFREIISAYDDNSDDVVRLLRGLDGFLADVGPEAELHDRAVVELAAFSRVLAEEDERLLNTLTDVRSLAVSGTDIIVTHRQRFDDFNARFRTILAEITERDEDLDRLFPELSGHNYQTIRGINAEFAQIIADFILCGENDSPGDPVRACGPDAPTGIPRPQPRPRQDF